MKEFTDQEVREALNQAVEEGLLHMIVKDGEPFYIENTFQAGYEYARKEFRQQRE